MIEIICILIASACWGFCSLYNFGKLTDGYGFFQRDSWVRKYEVVKNDLFELTFLPRRKNLYYKLFKVKYKERFPGSATIFVFVTDAYHLFQWVAIKAILLAATRDPIEFVMLWGCWSVGFQLVYTFFKQK